MDAAPTTFAALPVDPEVGLPVPFACGTDDPYGAPASGPDAVTLGGKALVFAQLVVGTVVGGATYALVTWLLGVRELRTIVAILADLIRRRGRS